MTEPTQIPPTQVPVAEAKAQQDEDSKSSNKDVKVTEQKVRMLELFGDVREAKRLQSKDESFKKEKEDWSKRYHQHLALWKAINAAQYDIDPEYSFPREKFDAFLEKVGGYYFEIDLLPKCRQAWVFLFLEWAARYGMEKEEIRAALGVSQSEPGSKDREILTFDQLWEITLHPQKITTNSLLEDIAE